MSSLYLFIPAMIKLPHTGKVPVILAVVVYVSFPIRVVSEYSAQVYTFVRIYPPTNSICTTSIYGYLS